MAKTSSSFMVDVRLDPRLALKIGEYPRAAKRAIDRTAEQARTYSSDLIRDQFSVSKTELENVTKGKARTGKRIFVQKATRALLGAVLVFTNRPIPLIKFQARWGGRSSQGVTALGRLYRSHFIPTMPSGHKGVFIRKGPKVPARRGRYAKGKVMRQKIMEVAGPSAAQLVDRAGISEKVRAFILQKFMENFKHEVEYRPK